MSAAHKTLLTFVSSRVLLHHRQRGARGWLGEWVTPTLFHLRLHLLLREACLEAEGEQIECHQIRTWWYTVKSRAFKGRDAYQVCGTHIQLRLWGDVALHGGIDNLSVPQIYSGGRRKLLKRFLKAGHGLMGGGKLLGLFALLLLHVFCHAGLWDVFQVLIWSMRASGAQVMWCTRF